MTTPGFTIPDRHEAYAPDPQSAWMQTDIDAIISGIRDTGVLSGCAVTPQGSPDMSVHVAAGEIVSGATPATVSADDVTITAADPDYPRVDCIVAHSDGSVGVVDGTPDQHPWMGAIDPDDVLLAAVLVEAGVTSIISDYIVDKRVFMLDHGSAYGLEDDDHPQYLRVDSSAYALLAGRPGGQNLRGGAAAGEGLILHSTAHATLGNIFLGDDSVYDELNIRLGIGTVSPQVAFDLVGDMQTTGFLSVGASSPNNVTAGDLTSIRAVVGDDVAIDYTTYQNAAMVVSGTYASSASGNQSLMFASLVYTANADDKGGRALNAKLFVRPSAANAAQHFGIAFAATHDSGAFNLTGEITGVLSTVTQAVGSTTLAALSGFVSSLVVSAGTATTVRGFLAQIGSSSGGTAITSLNFYDITLTSIPAAVATVRGLNVPNLGHANATSSIGLEIAAQSGAITNNFGIRNAGNSVQTGYARFGAVTAPLNTAAGDLFAVRMVLGTDVLMDDATSNATTMVINTTFRPTTGTVLRTMVNWTTVVTPDADNVSFLGGQLRLFVRPLQADSGAGFGVAFTWNHDSGAFNLTSGSHSGMLSTVIQGVGSSTVTGLAAFTASMTVSAGTVTTLRGFQAQFNASAGAAITSLNYYDMSQSATIPSAVTTIRGLNVPNLGNANATNAIGIEIAAQSGAATLNFAIRNAGNSVQTGYARFGAVTAPTNTTDGDVTLVRLAIGNGASFSGNALPVLLQTSTTVPTNADTFLVYLNQTWNPDGSSTAGTRRVSLNISHTVAPSASDAGFHAGIRAIVNHSSGAFNLTDTVNGIATTISQAVGSTTVTTMTGVQINETASAGTVTTMEGVRSNATLTGATEVTTFRHFHIVVNSHPTAGTTHVGLNIPNLGNAAWTTAVGIDLAAQSGAGTNNFGIRNAGNMVQTGYMRVGAVTVPTNTTDGDLTATRLFVPNAAVVNGSVIRFSLASLTPASTNYGVYESRVTTPNGGNVASSQYRRTELYVRPSAADSGGFHATEIFVTHDSGSFDLTGNLIGLIVDAKQQTDSTTVSNLVVTNMQAVVTAGDVTALECYRGQLILAGGGTVTQAVVFNVIMSSFPTALTTVKGLNVPNLGNAAVTTAIGIDVAAQSGAATLNIGIRNAGTYVGTGLIDLSGISAGAPNFSLTATSDTPAVTWGAAAGNEASAAPAGYIEITVGANTRYIPFWA